MWCLKPKGGRNAGILQDGKSASVMLLSKLANLAALSVNGMQLQLVQALSVRACLRY